ncbi:MAG: hypothetical protein MJY70_00940 [Bacteroidales bacterium]|nr:hypothetical protein [Bacteroidales bacterium]
MKRILTMIALAVLSVGLLGSCSKNYDERLDKTDASVADIKAAIGQYENLKGDITSVIEALRAEVGTRPASEQKTIWDCINALQNQKGTFEAAIAALNALVGNEAVSVQIDEAIAELISDYHLDGLAADIQAIRDKLNEKSGISALADQVAQLQKRAESIARILSVIGAYEDMIQSVRINPASADGSVTAERGILTFTFTVTPAEALSGVKNLKGCLKLYANEVVVKTKAGGFAEIPVTKAEVIDKANGEVSVEADVAKFLPNRKAGALSIALNVRTGVNDYTTEFVTVSNYIPDYLPGFFTVNGEGKQVRFSKGNLVATIDATDAPTAWKFAANQYEYIGENVANTKIGQKKSGDVDLFGWSTDAASNNWGIHTKIAATKNFTTGNFKDWGKAVGDGNTWRTLSKAEWTYLVNKEDNENIRKGKYKYGVTVCGKTSCLILAPDDFEGTIAESYDAAAWATAEAAGLVCLPAAGSRGASSVTNVGTYGFYWSSSKSGDEEEAYDLRFTGSEVNPGGRREKRHIGCSVRLVMDVE